MKFGLSNRQRKELIDRGRPLRIALPAPDLQDYDPRRWAAEVLADIEPGWIVSAEELDLPIYPYMRDAGNGLGHLLGALTPDPNVPAAQQLSVLVVCVVVELRAGRVARQPPGLTQWAVACEVD